MTPRGAGWLLAVLAATAAGCRGRSAVDHAHRVAELTARQERLWTTFNERVAGDPLLGAALADEGEVLLALRRPLLQGMVTEVARRYLDRVELDLDLDAKVKAGGELKVKTLVGQVNAGTWTVDLDIGQVRGVLRAQQPQVSLAGDQRLALSLPVSLTEATGRATVHFTWDSRGLANAVCRDFDVTRTVRGRILPSVETFQGALRLVPSAEDIVAKPSFANRPYRLKVDLAPESWAEVRAALEEQDSFFKCGLALEPARVVSQLRDLTLKGFDVRLPRSLFRDFVLPASIEQSLQADSARLLVSVKPNALRTVEDALWLSAALQVRRQEATATSRRAAPSRARR
jgi:hypothetical protein